MRPRPDGGRAGSATEDGRHTTRSAVPGISTHRHQQDHPGTHTAGCELVLLDSLVIMSLTDLDNMCIDHFDNTSLLKTVYNNHNSTLI